MNDVASTVTATETSALVACKAQIERELATAQLVSVVRLLELLFEYALLSGASDIHLNPIASGIQVRIRVDGVLQDIYCLPSSMAGELYSRLKILSGLRTDEHFAAQDGRFQITRADGSRVDIRISMVPVYYGENAVLRLLAGTAEAFTLTKLGFTVANQAAITNALAKPYGMILVTGPTGSGKTTTLYTLLGMLDSAGTAIVTIEDPIEYAIAGVNQIQVQPRTGLTFASGLRSLLRQDPDTIMVGEIRDGETAGLAVNVSLTGHLVLSTLHTNDAATTLPRLLDMKVEPYLIASTVNVAVGQRLVRRLCMSCRMPYILTDAVAAQVDALVGVALLPRGSKLYQAVGCVNCNQSGYRGRIGIHEVLTMSEALRVLVLERAPARTLRLQAVREGMVPLCQDGFEKVKAGITTLEEIFRLNHE